MGADQDVGQQSRTTGVTENRAKGSLALAIRIVSGKITKIEVEHFALAEIEALKQ